MTSPCCIKGVHAEHGFSSYGQHYAISAVSNCTAVPSASLVKELSKSKTGVKVRIIRASAFARYSS